MTLKDWNSLPLSKRRRIVNIVYGHMSEEFRMDMSGEFHHNFDYEDGRWYKAMLANCHKQKNGDIKVSVLV